MILIFGGAYQGKLEYAVERFGLNETDIYRCSYDDGETPGGRKLVYELDKWILALIKTETDTEEAVKGFILDNKDAIVLCNDISCGIVPENPLQRKWREAVGRALSVLANESDEVVRLFCGIPTVLKCRM